MAASVFISYARKDGADAAHALHDLLRGAGHTVWLDTQEIHGGASWSREIEDALNACEVLLAVLTPASYISEICRAEQIWALDEGKLVIPVLAVASAPIPLYLKTRNYRKYPAEQAQLLADIGSQKADVEAVERPLRYDTIPILPQNFLMREEPLAKLRNLVFTEGTGANIAVTAMAGMGGVGKTVLATALCRDPAVQRAFPDGIAWITIGREWNDDFVTRMREVARALGDDLGGYDNSLACENRYRTILREKAALVVVDDVWNVEHLKPLLVDAPRSRFLFTTRDGSIAKAVTDRRYSANLLAREEARELLARWSGIGTVAALPSEADEIIEQCGDLAAAVAQVGAILRDLSAAEWRDTLGELKRADISAIEGRLPTGQESFFKSLAVTVEALRPEMQERYLRLAVLLEDMPAPLALLQTLWGVNEAEGRKIARYFVDRSLATWDTAADPERGIKLHDLQLDYVRARYLEREALDLIHGAIRLSAHVIEDDPLQFASQMIGRLLPYARMSGIQPYLDQMAAGAPAPWLRPLHPALHPPGTPLLRTLEGHSGSVVGVAVTPDGRRAISASGDNTLKVWDLETARALRTLEGHSGYVSGVAVTPDGRWAVSASADHTLKVWDLETARVLRTLKGHSNRIRGVAVTPDGRRALSASDDKTLKVWNLESGQAVRTLQAHSDVVLHVAVTPDGQRAVSASEDKTLKVWDLESGDTLRTLEGHSFGVTAVTVTADGRRAVSGSYDNTLNVWDLKTGRVVRKLEGHSGPVHGVALTTDGRRAVSASWDKTLRLWDLTTGETLRTFEGHSRSVRGVAVGSDGRRAVSASYDNTLKVWDLEGGHTLPTLESHSAGINGLAVTPDGRCAVSASGDHTLKIWNLESGHALRTLEGHSNFLTGVAVTADGRRAVSASHDNTLKVWDLESGRALCTLEGHSAGVKSVAVTPDGQRAVSASDDNTLKVWHLETGRALRTLEGHSHSVNGVAITPNGQQAVSASGDKTLKVWDLETGCALRTLKGHSRSIRAVAVTPDGEQVVSASRDCTLKVWDLQSGYTLRTVEGHSSFVLGVALTPDGRRAVSASYDNTVRAWELETGLLIAMFCCDAPVICCAFADAKRIVAGDYGGRIYFLSLEEPTSGNAAHA